MTGSFPFTAHHAGFNMRNKLEGLTDADVLGGYYVLNRDMDGCGVVVAFRFTQAQAERLVPHIRRMGLRNLYVRSVASFFPAMVTE